jgi:hypothetical protein
MLNRLFQTFIQKTINLIIITVYDLDIQEIGSVMSDVLLACKYLVGKPEWKGSFAKQVQNKSQNHNSPQYVKCDIITFIWSRTRSSCEFCKPCNEHQGSTKV